MRDQLRIWLVISITCFAAGGCINDEGRVPETNDTIAVSKDTARNDDVHIFTLPAPLQVATMLRLDKEPFDSRYLAAGVPQTNFATNYSRALNTGVYLVDMGYASIYDQRQASLNHARAVEKLMTDLGIKSTIKQGMVKRFEANLTNNDSLCKIILESYGQTHNYFQENGREEVGLFIMCGSYVEGLNIILHSKEVLNNSQLKNLVGQQKIFLDNILVLCDYMTHQEEVQELRQTLKEIEKGFSGITFNMSETPQGAIATQCSITPDQLKQLTEKVHMVRRKITAI
jgi:hypothetical protein